MTPGWLPPGSRVSEVALTVSDLSRTGEFYTSVLGLELLGRSEREWWLGAGGIPFLRLVDDPRARHVRGTARLYHFALLYPSRADLADALGRLVERGVPLQGASDHLVSEAIYLADPEGNGIELYRDRPRVAWPQVGGRLQMDTLPLDLRQLLADARRSDAPAAAGTTVGHVHLHVLDLAHGEAFYRDLLGLGLTLRYGDSASFLAAGGYHHHLGINTWGMAGARPAPEGALGLRWYRVSLPDREALASLAERLRAAGVSVGGEEEGEARFADPSGHRLVVDVR